MILPFAGTMTTAFVLISTAPHREVEVRSKLISHPEFKEIHLLFGDYDMIAKIDAKNYIHLGRIVVEKIRATEGVIHTETLTGMNM